MGEFFRGWRRKIGVLTLLMALVLMAGWVRSSTNRDWIAFHAEKHWVVFGSDSQRLYCMVDYSKNHVNKDGATWKVPSFGSAVISKNDPLAPASLDDSSHSWSRYWLGFSIWQKTYWDFYQSTLYVIPYWSVVIPLTLASAFLLLTKPRQSTQKKVTKTVTSAGA